MATMRTIESESTLVGASAHIMGIARKPTDRIEIGDSFMLPPVYILIEDNPNCTSLDGLIFQPKALPRQVKRVRVACDGRLVSCDVVAVNEGWATEPAMASPIDDSGDGARCAELFEPAQKIEQLLRDGFLQCSSPGVATAYSDVRGKYMLFKSCSTGGKIDGH